MKLKLYNASRLWNFGVGQDHRNLLYFEAAPRSDKSRSELTIHLSDKFPTGETQSEQEISEAFKRKHF
jgi:hypothetical protein